jgi:hypothetical protein
MSAPALRRRNANQGGDPIESDRLRDPFLRWVGKRSNRAALAEAGIDIVHGSAWLIGQRVLAARYQCKVRVLLDASGVEVSPCS